MIKYDTVTKVLREELLLQIKNFDKMQLSTVVWAYANVGFKDDHLFHQVGLLASIITLRNSSEFFS